MLRLNSVNSINNYKHFQKAAFKGNDSTQTNPQVNQIQDVNPDFSVKVPLTYSKTGEMNFPYDTKAHCYKLSNGQKVVIIPQEGETVLKTYVNTGSMNEPDNLRGISHYIEHNLFNGSKGFEKGDFFKQVDKMGANSNASTGFAETNYFISSNLLNDSDLENQIRLHASMIETPIFAAEKLEKEKGIVNSEINMIVSNPENLAINKMLKNLYGIKSSSTDMIGGTTDNITNLTREDVMNYFNKNYYPANMVTVISGNVNPDDTIKLISKHFTSKKTPGQNRYIEKLTPTQKTVREDLISDKATATSIVLGFNGPKDSKERVYMEALTRLLSGSNTSRINKNIKQYNTGSWAEEEKITTDNDRTVIFMSECNDENSEKVLKTFFNEIGNIANNPPTDDEMQIIKKRMLKTFSNIFEESYPSNNLIGKSILENNTDYINNYESIVKSMTAQDLVNTAKKYLDLNKVSVTLVHPASATEESISKNYKQVSFTGSKKEAINPSSVKEFNLQNNYRVALVNSKTNNVKILYKLSVDKDIETKPSAAIVLSALLNEGSIDKKQSDFDTNLAKEGITKGFAASQHAITSSFSCDIDTISKSFDSIKEVIENPRFKEAEFEQVKNRIKDNILTSEKSAFDKLGEELYKGLPNGYSKTEILQDLETLTLDDVITLHKKLISQSKGSVTISAPFNRKPELKNQVFSNIASFENVKTFSPKELQNIYKPVETTKVLTDTDFKNQAEIIEAYKFKTNGNLKDMVTIKLLNTILGGNSSSRLFNDLREKEKLAYHVRSHYESNNDIGIISLRIGTTTENKETGETSFDNVQKSINGFNRHIEKIKSEKVSEEELNNAKLNYKNIILNLNHTGADRAGNVLDGINNTYGAMLDNLILEEIDKITVDDIYNAANYIFSGKPTYSIVATENTLKVNEEYLKSLIKD